MNYNNYNHQAYIDSNKQTKPQPWYLGPSNYGKLIMVRDNDYSDWTIDTFIEHDKSCTYPFRCERENAKFARPATMDDLKLIE